MIFRKFIPTVLVILMSWLNGGYAMSSALALDHSLAQKMTDKIEAKYQSLPTDKKIKFLKKQIKRSKKLSQKIAKKSDTFFSDLNEELSASDKKDASKDIVKQAIESDGAEKISNEESLVFSDVQADLEKLQTTPSNGKKLMNKKSISQLLERSITAFESELSKLQGDPERSIASLNADIAGFIFLGVGLAIFVAGLIVTPLLVVGIIFLVVGAFILGTNNTGGSQQTHDSI